MKIFQKVLLLVSLVFALSSCGDIEEEMWLNKDGSGKLEYKVDLSSSLPMMQMMLGAMDTTETGNVQGAMDGFFEAMGGEVVDSTNTLYSLMPDSIKTAVVGSDKLKNVSINIKANKEEDIALIKLGIKFKSFAEIDEMIKLIGETRGEDGPAAMMDGMMPGISFNDSQYFTKKFYKRRPMSGGEDGGFEDLMGQDPESAGMVEMMFGSSQFIQTMHFPHKVKSTNSEEAKIDGNTVVLRRDFMDLMKQSSTDEFEVTFKKKFLGIF